MKKNKVVKHSNLVSRARFDYSETQLNLFYFILAGLDKDKKEQEYVFRVADFVALMGKKANAKHIKEAVDGMMHKVFHIPEPDGSYEKYVFFDYIRYTAGTATFRVVLGQRIQPLLFELQGKFTKIDLFYYLQLNSKYAKRLYTLLSSWRNNVLADGVTYATQEYLLDDLRVEWYIIDPETGDNLYPDWSSFNRFVITKAIQQINAKTNFKVLQPKLTKQGHGFKKIQFFFQQQVAKVQPPNITNLLNDVRPTVHLTASNTQSSYESSDQALLSWTETEQVMDANQVYFDKAQWTYLMLCQVPWVTKEFMTVVFRNWNNLHETYRILHGRYVNELPAPTVEEIQNRFPGEEAAEQ